MTDREQTDMSTDNMTDKEQTDKNKDKMIDKEQTAMNPDKMTDKGVTDITNLTETDMPKDKMAYKEETDITELIEETENTQFLIESRVSQEDDTEGNLKEVESFLRESNQRLNVLEEERRKSFSIEMSPLAENGPVDVGADGKQGEGPLEANNDVGGDDEEQETAFKALQQALKELTNLDDYTPPSESSAKCRQRSFSTSQTMREKTPFPVLESCQDHVPSISNNVNRNRRKTFDINSLEQELAKLMFMSDSLVYPPTSGYRVPSSPKPVPTTPPCTPSSSLSGHHPLSPSEVYHMRYTSQNQNATAAPPPKPPRLYLPANEEAGTSSEPTLASSSHHPAVPPPKPPRLHLKLSADRLRNKLAKLSRSTGNLSVLDESQEPTKTEEPRSAEALREDGSDANMSSTKKMEKLLSKLTYKRKNKRSQSLLISAPSDFKHLSGGSKKETDRPASAREERLEVSNVQENKTQMRDIPIKTISLEDITVTCDKEVAPSNETQTTNENTPAAEENTVREKEMNVGDTGRSDTEMSADEVKQIPSL